MVSRLEFDAVIVGGGPAGAIAAITLATLNWRVALLERGRRDRDKVCGCCLAPRAMPMLASLNLTDLVQSVAVSHTDSLHLHAADDCSMEARFARGPGLVVPRSALDQALRDEAALRGAAVFQPAALVDFQQENGPAGSFTVTVKMGDRTSRISAGMIIGADGLRSLVARLADLGDPNPGRKYGFSFDFELADSQPMRDHSIAMHLTADGYLGMVRAGRRSAHVAALVSTSRSPAQVLDEMAAGFPRLAPSGLGANAVGRGSILATGPMPWRPRRVACPGVALIGDAAGYVEPFTGEGITWAIHGAALLGQVASSQSPGSWRAQAAAEYDQRWHCDIGRGHARCSLIAAMIARRWLTAMTCRLARAWPRLAELAASKLVAA